MLNVEELKLKLQKFDLIDCTILSLILLISFGIGIYFMISKKKLNPNRETKDDVEETLELNGKNSEELKYLVGNRNMREFPVAMSLIASFISGISMIGLSTEIYLYGVLYAYTIPTIILAGIICWYIFLPIFCNLQLTSIYEYFELRFDRKIRHFGSFVNFIGITFWMPMVIYVPGLVLNQFTGINIYLVCAVISIVCIFYTCVGGITAVIWSDFFQSFIMLFSILLIMIKGIMTLGGLKNIFDINYNGERIELPEITFDTTVRYSFFAILFGGTISWIESTCCGQVMMQRFLSVSSFGKARKVLIYYVIGISIILMVCTFNGLILYAYYHNCDPLTTKLAKIKDQLLPVFTMELFYGISGLNGLFIGGILSAALSTLSTGLNSLAAIFLEDFLKLIYPRPLSEKHTIYILKLFIISFGVISFTLVFLIENLGMIFQLSRTLGSVCGGPLFGLFLMGVLMPWINSKSALMGCVSAFLLMSWICIGAQNSYYVNKPLSVLGCSYDFNQTTNSLTVNNLDKSNENSGHQQTLSYLWYSPLGSLVTVLIANLSTIFFGNNPRNNWNKNLTANFLRKYIPESNETIKSNTTEEHLLK